MIPEDKVIAHRNRALNPNKPFVRGTAQNPDVYFQGREASGPFYTACPDEVASVMEKFASLTGRHYRPFEYYGHAEAERIVIIMGSGYETVQVVVSDLNRKGEKLGLSLFACTDHFLWIIFWRYFRILPNPLLFWIGLKNREP